MESHRSILTNQKEYLKKYLSKKPGEKKKKKSKHSVKRNVTIIDDNLDFNHSACINNELEDEDAPQVVAVIDERPIALQVDDKTHNPLWKPVGENREFDISECIVDTFNIKPHSFQVGKMGVSILGNTSGKCARNTKHRCEVKATSSLREQQVKGEVPRSTYKRSQLNFAFRNQDADSTPSNSNVAHNDDLSPVRVRKQVIDDDSSPPRRRPKEVDDSLSMESSQHDMSPPRRTRKRSNTPDVCRKGIARSPTRKHESYSKDKMIYGEHYKIRERKHSRWHSPQSRDTKYTSDRNEMGDVKGISRSNLTDSLVSNKKPRRNVEPSEIKYKIPQRRMDKTLDGKQAGLQSAEALVRETQEIKDREDRLFHNLPTHLSGEHAVTVLRDRKTGKIRDLKKEMEDERIKQKHEQEQKDKYYKWGKGLAQMESKEERMQEEQREMNKPLARYADDEDLEKYLKEIERDEDPMLQYLRKKRKKDAASKGELEKPQFEGNFLPNRYGIRPGYRWDGVDRSNGYEKKWFETQNARKAQIDEAYKWSTEDM